MQDLFSIVQLLGYLVNSLDCECAQNGSQMTLQRLKNSIFDSLNIQIQKLFACQSQNVFVSEYFHLCNSCTTNVNFVGGRKKLPVTVSGTPSMVSTRLHVGFSVITSREILNENVISNEKINLRLYTVHAPPCPSPASNYCMHSSTARASP